jgi:hypothetical protein
MLYEEVYKLTTSPYTPYTHIPRPYTGYSGFVGKGIDLVDSWGERGGGFAGVLRSGRLTFEQMMRAWGA